MSRIGKLVVANRVTVTFDDGTVVSTREHSLLGYYGPIFFDSLPSHAEVPVEEIEAEWFKRLQVLQAVFDCRDEVNELRLRLEDNSFVFVESKILTKLDLRDWIRSRLNVILPQHIEDRTQRAA